MTSLAVDESSGEQYNLIYTAGTPKTVTGAAVLVPNSYLEREWTTQIVTADDGMEARVFLGGIKVASYPLNVSVSKVASPTRPAESTTATPETTHVQPQESTESGLPGANVKPPADSSKQSSAASENEAGSRSGKGWLIAALVVVSILLVICLLAAGVLAYQNRILKKKMNRRQALKRK